MATVDFMTRGGFERRLGRRVPVHPVDVTWVLARSSRLGRRRRPLEVPGRIDDVSITGVAILGPPGLELEPGSKVIVRSRGRDSVVVVRHRAPSGDGTTARFGVELPAAASALGRQVRDLLDPVLTPSPSWTDDATPWWGPPIGDRDETAVAGAPPTLSASSSAPVPDGPVALVAPPAEPVVDPAERDDPARPGEGTGLEGSDAESLRDGVEVLIDLTDATIGAHGGPLVDLTRPGPIEAASGPDPSGPEPRSHGREALDDVFRLMDD